ncbi:hypothetical protein TVAG_005260 [Trichomonas vaginalis G3]|uniref:Uncharacterized protein n=1 Tax=Trichomonas vaginalis (strain ATCC PRA-98 / G3) TaxID=412133 RepID=A2ENQ7_TRIV3|nr:hypothetical protein TVAGG3_0666280 [Trichomonas vaginalis G3]EAY05683.1 hypothetical protein TVAG_005260 [Trichomonas vaginalis G3]KAI5506853.1 hypothetical protein TVAGG3_0666280 [Trichomonas vaginalis G3]|eukprot:XP_001317906.1 hypothetical protein [Trichomonas vaginalis G3]
MIRAFIAVSLEEWKEEQHIIDAARLSESGLKYTADDKQFTFIKSTFYNINNQADSVLYANKFKVTLTDCSMYNCISGVQGLIYVGNVNPQEGTIDRFALEGFCFKNCYSTKKDNGCVLHIESDPTDRVKISKTAISGVNDGAFGFNI